MAPVYVAARSHAISIPTYLFLLPHSRGVISGSQRRRHKDITVDSAGQEPNSKASVSVSNGSDVEPNIQSIMVTASRLNSRTEVKCSLVSILEIITHITTQRIAENFWGLIEPLAVFLPHQNTAEHRKDGSLTFLGLAMLTTSMVMVWAIL
jgi:hypothetical protein